MSEKKPAEQHSSLNVGDIYYVLFRQKWIVLSCLVASLLAVGAVFIIRPALYQSDALLYVQYVTGVRNPSQNNGEPTVQVTDPNGGNVLNTEMQFLTSQDLAREVVTNLGAERILAAYGVAPITNTAVGVVMKNLVTDDTPKTPSIIHIGFQHPDPIVAQEVLQEIIVAYIIKSADMHRPGQVTPESLMSEIERLRGTIADTEKKLRQANADAGIISSLDDTRKGLNDQFQRIEGLILEAESHLAENGAVVEEATSKTNSATAAAATNASTPIPPEVVDEYKLTREALNQWQMKQLEGLTKYTPGGSLYQEIKDHIDEYRNKKQALESQYPGLIGTGSVVTTPATGQSQTAQIMDGQSEISREKAKIALLKKKQAEIKEAQSRLDTLEPSIVELERKKEVEMTQRAQLLANYEHAMDSTAQGNRGGIKIDESPTPAVKRHSKSFKKLLMAALALPIGGGLGLAFVIEWLLDSSVRRPGEVEGKLHLPLFITIPELSGNGNGNGNGHRRAALPAFTRKLLKGAGDGALVPNGNGSSEHPEANALATQDAANPLRRYCAGLRDRLIVNFEVRNLHHNPKLVAVTSCGAGAGVSSIAAGLAASLSETGDGNVLLVNMRGEQGAARQFYNGKPACGLDDALASETKENAFIHENLYVANEGGDATDLPRILPKRFAGLMPKLKASDFDYIIFDMPPVSQTSVTPRLAGLMDMVLLVIESEKTKRDTVQRATKLLAESKANVSAVLNKVKTHVPTGLHQEYLDDEA